MSSGVNMLTSSLKISDTAKTDFLELIFLEIDQKLWQKYCREDLCSVSDCLTCWVSMTVLVRDFSGIE